MESETAQNYEISAWTSQCIFQWIQAHVQSSSLVFIIFLLALLIHFSIWKLKYENIILRSYYYICNFIKGVIW